MSRSISFTEDKAWVTSFDIHSWIFDIHSKYRISIFLSTLRSFYKLYSKSHRKYQISLIFPQAVLLTSGRYPLAENQVDFMLLRDADQRCKRNKIYVISSSRAILPIRRGVSNLLATKSDKKLGFVNITQNFRSKESDY